MENSVLNNIPGELLGYVLDRADGPSLAALSRTCRDLNYLATRHLYRSVYIRHGKCNEFVRTIDCKYGDLVHGIFVDTSSYMFLSPCRIAPCLEKLPNLRSLTLEGYFGRWNDRIYEKNKREMWRTYQDRLWGVLETASLEELPQLRILQNLRCLTLDLFRSNGQGWYMDSSVVFLIQPLHELTIRGIILEEVEGETDPKFHRQTELKVLRVERSFINFLGLRNALLAPRALTHLVLEHDPFLMYNDLVDARPNEATVDELVDVLSVHRRSLQEICFSDKEVQGQTINDDSFAPYATRFPVLRRWVGFDVLSLRKFLNDYN